MRVKVQEIKNGIEIGYREKVVTYEELNAFGLNIFVDCYEVEEFDSFYAQSIKADFYFFRGAEEANADIIYIVTVSIE